MNTKAGEHDGTTKNEPATTPATSLLRSHRLAVESFECFPHTVEGGGENDCVKQNHPKTVLKTA